MTLAEMTLVTTKKCDCNTFSFYAAIVRGRMIVIVKQFTDFTDSILADDFPNGSTMHWRKSFPKTVSMEQAINTVGKGLLKEWNNVSLS